MASVGSPPGISRSGAGACRIVPSHARQAYFGRCVTSWRYWTGMTSRRREVSSPIRCSAPAQQGQAERSGSMVTCTSASASGKDGRPWRRSRVRLSFTASGAVFSASACTSAIFCSRFSSASASWSGSSFSELLPKLRRFSLAT